MLQVSQHYFFRNLMPKRAMRRIPVLFCSSADLCMGFVSFRAREFIYQGNKEHSVAYGMCEAFWFANPNCDAS